MALVKIKVRSLLRCVCPAILDRSAKPVSFRPRWNPVTNAAYWSRDALRLAGEFLQKRLACILRTFKSRVELGHRRGPPGTRGKAIWEAPGFSTTQIARRKAARTCLRARLPTHFLLWFSARRVACRAMILKRGEFIASSALMPRRAHSFRNKRSAKAPSHFARRRRSSCDSISVIDANLPQPPTACVVSKAASLSPATRLSSKGAH